MNDPEEQNPAEPNLKDQTGLTGACFWIFLGVCAFFIVVPACIFIWCLRWCLMEWIKI